MKNSTRTLRYGDFLSPRPFDVNFGSTKEADEPLLSTLSGSPLTVGSGGSSPTPEFRPKCLETRASLSEPQRPRVQRRCELAETSGKASNLDDVYPN